VDRLIGEDCAEEDRPLDIDATALDIDRDTGDGADTRAAPEPADGPMIAPMSEARVSSGGEAPASRNRAFGETLAEHLHAQIGAQLGHGARAIAPLHRAFPSISSTRRAICPRPARHRPNCAAPLAEIEAALALVQSLDPTAWARAACRNVSRCRPGKPTVTTRRWPPDRQSGTGGARRICPPANACARGREDLADMLAELRSYDPKPGLRWRRRGRTGGARYSGERTRRWRLVGGVNQATLPRLMVNRSYYVEMRGACGGKEGRDDRGWLSEKLADANWLVKALDQRQKTILKVASELVPAGGLFPPRRAPSEAADAARGGGNGGAARIDREPGDQQQILLCARHVRAEIFLHLGRASADGEGRCRPRR
jgi:RNA polymerase sigma-54 factor